jgi:hypothetical protein
VVRREQMGVAAMRGARNAKRRREPSTERNRPGATPSSFLTIINSPGCQGSKRGGETIERKCANRTWTLPKSLLFAGQIAAANPGPRGRVPHHP